MRTATTKRDTGPGGRPSRLPNGENATALGGDGLIVEILHTGTGFVASKQGHVLANRHVALPWLYDAALDPDDMLGGSSRGGDRARRHGR